MALSFTVFTFVLVTLVYKSTPNFQGQKLDFHHLLFETKLRLREIA